MTKIINNYENYEIHLDGPNGKPAVYSLRNSKYLKTSLGGNGYEQTILSDNGKDKTVKIHRLVAQHFIENPKGYLTVDHIDKDKLNNKAENLRWATRAHQEHNKPNVKGYTKRGKKWVAQIKCNAKLYRIGTFETEEEAREAYIKKAKVLFPELYE